MLSPSTSRSSLAESAIQGMERTICAIRYARAANLNPTPTQTTGPGRGIGTATHNNRLAPESLRQAGTAFDHRGLKPPLPADPATEEQISTLRKELAPVLSNPRSQVWHTTRNTPRDETESFKHTLSSRRDITILPTDKTNRMSVLDSTLVDQKLTEHMATGWEPLLSDPSSLYETEANNLLATCLQQASIRDTYVEGRLKSRHTQAPHLFPLAKDHKSGFPDVPLR